VPYRGLCLVHRAQIMTMQGSWADAIEEAQVACDRLDGTPLGDAWYVLGELRRLRGEFEAAESAYRRANSEGRQPEPGLAQLRMAQGRVEAAVTTLRRLYDEQGRMDRADILVAYVDAMIRAADFAAAAEAARELTESAASTGSPLRRARGAVATASVLVAEGSVQRAIPQLRGAWRELQELGVRGTCRTSTPSSASPRGPLPPPTPTITSWSDYT
jgi:tetratricopeptide (TPR) repeat protein